MSLLPIRCFPDPILRKPAEKVAVFDRSLAAVIENMRETMLAQPHGIGIAAPQVGISRQIAIVDVSRRIAKASMLILINPVILNLEMEKISREGCMSLPDYTGNLKRYESVRLRWQDQSGEFHERSFEGIEAICIQHEVDHLNGVLFMDRISSLKRDMIPRERKSRSKS